MRKVVFIILLLAIGYTAFTCLNERHVTKGGNESIDAYSMSYFPRAFDQDELRELLEKHRAMKPEGFEDSIRIQNNIAVYLIKLGELESASQILHNNMKSKPNDYSTIVNLGTLYELQGSNKKALEFIKRAISIDPESHNGSEWFHVAVLEYKLRNRTNGQLLGDDILKLKRKTGDNIHDEIAYQLSERLPFTPTPDLMMAKILLEYGDFLAEKVSIKGAYVIYGIAEEYDQFNLLPIADRKKQLLPLFTKYKETVPDYKRYFLHVENDDKSSGTVTSLLEDGIKMILSKNKEEEKPNRSWIWLSAAAVVLITGFFVFKRKGHRKPKTTSNS